MHGRALLAAGALAPTIRVQCAPIADEIAVTEVGFAPLAWLVAFLVARWMFAPAADQPRTPAAWVGPIATLAVLLGLAGLAIGSPDFEDDAWLAAVLLLGPAAIGYTIVIGRLWQATGSRHTAAWTALLAIAVLIVPALITWVAEDALEDLALSLTMLVVLSGALAVFPLALLAQLTAFARNRAQAEWERADDAGDLEP